uniref:Uncharacterized protein n=1 Tax=Mycena chlorophos TaxID=658473 RepID=A0ABQ0M2L1_MYCCL|nr:predicted protein [Mycena chlorophos]
MSLSSYFKRQSRVIRNSTVSAFGLSSILEEDHDNNTTKSSVKAKRRHGVSDLRIPPLESFQTDLPALQSSSDDESSSSSDGLPSTPSASPTHESFTGQAIIRCKSIRPLALVPKRSISPVPTLSSEEEDDVYYAAHARGYVTLRRSSSLTPESTAQRDSTLITRRFSIPNRPPPPPPIDTNVPNFSHPTAATVQARPPPRTPVPTDAWSGDYTDAATFLSASPSSSMRSESPAFSFSAASSSPSTSLDALLSPPPQFPPEAQGIPCDIDDADWEDEVYDEIPLSPSPLSLGAPSILPTISFTVPEPVEEPTEAPMPSPLPSPVPRPRNSSHSTQLRSRWSSSTLSSVHSSRGAKSPKTFAFAKRYLRVKTPVLNIKTTPSTPVLPKPSPKRRPGKKRLTAKDVVVMHPNQQQTPRSPPPPVPPKPVIPPLPTTTINKPLPLPKTPSSAQWASYPSSPPPAPYIHAPAVRQSKQDALYTAYISQRSPRRRSRVTSSSSAKSGWSFSTNGSAYGAPSASSSDSGCSDWSSNASMCSSGSSDFGGLRRPPIPVDLFLKR